MNWFNKSPPNPPISANEFELAKAACLKLTPAEFYALTKVDRSPPHWPGLIEYYEYKANL